MADSYNFSITPGEDWTVVFLGYTGAWVVTLSGTSLGGSFTLTYRGGTTVDLAYNAAAATVQRALEALPSIGPGNVTVTGSAGGPYTVTLAGAAGQPWVWCTSAPIPADRPLPTPHGDNLTGTTPAVVVTREVQNVTTGAFALQARTVAASASPKIQVDATHTTQGSITGGGAAGTATVTLTHTATAALDFSDGANAGTAQYVMLRIVGSSPAVNTVWVTGRLTLADVIYV
jgi:hypothetical protein